MAFRSVLKDDIDSLIQVKKVGTEAYMTLTNFIIQKHKQRRFLQTFLETAHILENLDGDYIAAQTFQFLYGLAGQREKFLEWVESGYIGSDPDMPYLGVNSLIFFSDYQKEPRLKEILKKMDLSLTSTPLVKIPPDQQ